MSWYSIIFLDFSRFICPSLSSTSSCPASQIIDGLIYFFLMRTHIIIIILCNIHVTVSTKELRENKENVLKNVCVFPFFYVNYYCCEKFNDSSREPYRNHRKSQLRRWPPACSFIILLADLLDF